MTGTGFWGRESRSCCRRRGAFRLAGRRAARRSRAGTRRARPCRFQVVCGTSAGAINAAVLAAHAKAFGAGRAELARVWGGFRVGQVFRAGTFDMLRSGAAPRPCARLGGWLLPVPRALLDNSPLRALLARNIDFARAAAGRSRRAA